MVTNLVRKSTTDLQISLAVCLNSEKSIKHVQNYGVTCSFDEFKRFKRSAAKAASQDISLQGIPSTANGMVQIVADNFDADISSPNGKLSTHSLAMIMMQPQKEGTEHEHDTILRISKEEMSVPIECIDDQDASQLQIHCSPSKPPMPCIPAAKLTKTNTCFINAFVHFILASQSYYDRKTYNTHKNIQG